MVILFIAKDYSRFSALVTRLGQQQDIQLVPALTGTAGLAYLKDSTVDLAIVDEQLDDMSGIALVKQLVMASLRSTGNLRMAETMAVAIVIPADGPSLGIAPSGTWTWMSIFW